MGLTDPRYVTAWLVAFGLTVAIEVPVLAWLGRRAEPSARRRTALVLFANLASHPAVWFVFPALPLAWALTTALSETWAWLVEAALYRLTFARVRTREALLLSLAANLASFGTGLAFSALGTLH